jgi:TonB family protein
VLALPAAGAVEGRVLWNEEPVAGARVYVTAEYNFASTHYGETTTDPAGHFVITNVPSGQKYVYAFGNGPRYWVSAVTPFLMPPSGGSVAPDTYLCRGFDPASPTKGEALRTARPMFRWDPYPGAVDYAIRVIRAGQTAFVFSRGDRDARLTSTTVQSDVDLTPGDYTWRVDAFNRHGHIIGCSYYPRPFGIVMAQTALPVLPPLSSVSRDIDPDRHIHGIPLGTSVAQFVGRQGQPTGELHLSSSETVLLYGRSHAFSFEGDRLVGAWIRQNAYIVDFRLLERLTGSTPFDGLGWRLTNGVENGMTLAEIKRMLGGNTLFACAPNGFSRCYFTTERARVEFDLIPRGPAGGTGDEGLVAVGVIVRAASFAGSSPTEASASTIPPAVGVTAPRPLREVRPSYTKEALARKISGIVLVQGVVQTDGTLRDVRVIRSLDAVYGLDDEALKAARQWQFAPGTKDGQPTSVSVTIELTFAAKE